MTTGRIFTSLAALALIAGGAYAMSHGGSEPSDTHHPWSPVNKVSVKHPEWSQNAVLYQINTRQFNFTGAAVTAKLADGLAAGTYKEFRSGADVTFKPGDRVTVPANGASAEAAPRIMAEE